MSSELKTNKISPATGTALTLADSVDTLTLPAGARLDINGTVDFAGATVSNLSAGKIGQVAYGEVSDSSATVTTAAFMDSGLNVTLTPSAT